MRPSLLAAVAFLLLPFVVIAVAFAARGREVPVPPAPRHAPTRDPVADAGATPAPDLPIAGPGLAVGVTEFNPNLVASPAARELPAPWAGVRDALGAIRPGYFRLVIDWSAIQPSADEPADLEVPADRLQPGRRSRAWSGPAFATSCARSPSRQREGGWQALVVITWTPEWAAAGAGGCERPGTPARRAAAARRRAARLPELIADVLAAAEEEGATLRFWSPWNEPNHPGVHQPPARRLRPATPSAAPAVYTELARTMRQALDEAPGEQQLLLGETAGLLKPTRLVTSVPEFIAGLPSDLVCASPVWTQHAYVGGDDPVEATAAALAAHGCPQPHTLWITETGVGSAPRDLSAADAIPDPVAGCRALHDRLVQWWQDPRVTVAFQYTVREDDRFPTGLVTSDLTSTHPALAEWTAWGGARDPAAPPPPPTC